MTAPPRACGTVSCPSSPSSTIPRPRPGRTTPTTCSRASSNSWKARGEADPMPKYLISYRKTEETGQKPEWAAFTCENELAMEGHAIKERVLKRMSVLGEKLWGDGEAVWIGSSRLDDPVLTRGEAT